MPSLGVTGAQASGSAGTSPQHPTARPCRPLRPSARRGAPPRSGSADEGGAADAGQRGAFPPPGGAIATTCPAEEQSRAGASRAPAARAAGRGVGKRENPAHAPSAHGGADGWLRRSACARARHATPRDVSAQRHAGGTHKSVSFNFFTPPSQQLHPPLPAPSIVGGGRIKIKIKLRERKRAAGSRGGAAALASPPPTAAAPRAGVRGPRAAR